LWSLTVGEDGPVSAGLTRRDAGVVTIRDALAYPFRPVAGVGLEVDAPVSVVMAGVLGDP